MNKLKVINTFSDPQKTNIYLNQMIVLKPLAFSLLENLTQLNKQEEVYNLLLF